MNLLQYYHARKYRRAVEKYDRLFSQQNAVASEHNRYISQEPWQDKETQLLIHIYRTRPWWSCHEIAKHLYWELRAWDPDIGHARSGRACAKRLRVLHARGQLNVDAVENGIYLTWLKRLLCDVPFIPGSSSSETQTDDKAVRGAQDALCEHCRALDLGRLHMQPWKKQEKAVSRAISAHPASRTVHVFRESSQRCPCCIFIFSQLFDKVENAAEEELQLQFGLDIAPWAFDQTLQFWCHARYPGVYQSRLRIVHLNDWKPLYPWRDTHSSCTISQTIVPEPTVEEMSEQISRWQQNCDLRHRKCANQQARPMPRRAIYLGETKGSCLIQLRETKEQCEDYVALSYCWGGQIQYQLTAETSAELTEGIDAKLLPATIRDAIDLTRALGIAYIWIDALCILQDSRQDWEEQSAAMGSIYQNARLTLIASRAAAVTEGFLRPTRPHAVQCGAVTYKGRLRPIFLVADTTDTWDPLAKRGWAFQERHLSSCKVIFGSTELIWECTQVSVCESNSSQRLETYTPSLETLPDWTEWAAKYSQSLLTRPTDRLPAISGLAQRYAEQTGDEYLAGHWRNTLVQSLTWHIIESCDPAKRGHGYLAPSWSWASLGPAAHRFGGTTWFEVIAQLTDYSITLAGSNPYGEVADGWIEILAPVFEIDHLQVQPSPHFKNLLTSITADEFVSVVTGVSAEDVQAAHQDVKGRTYPGNLAIDLFWDCDEFASASMSLSCIVLTRSGQYRNLLGIIIESIPDCPGTFKRVGMFKDCLDVFTTSGTWTRKVRII